MRMVRLQLAVGYAALLVVLVALLVPAAAGAHIRSGVVAVDFRARVVPLRVPVRSAVTVRVAESDRSLELTVRRGHRVIVVGARGEPLLRLDAAGVAVNQRSPTAARSGLAKVQAPIAGAAPVWTRRSRDASIVWHDSRLRGLPRGVERGRWSIPLLVDGRRVSLEGAIWRQRAPSLWPWVLLGVPFVVFGCSALGIRRPPWAWVASIAFGLMAAAATVVSAAGFALGPNASGGRVVQAFYGGHAVAVGVAVVAGGAPTRRLAGAARLGSLALFFGLIKGAVFAHGFVLSALPSTEARVAVALALWSGATAAVVATPLLLAAFDAEPRIVRIQCAPNPGVRDGICGCERAPELLGSRAGFVIDASPSACGCRISRGRWRDLQRGWRKRRRPSAARRITVGGAPVVGQIDNERPSSRTYATATPGRESQQHTDRSSALPEGELSRGSG